MLLLCATVVGLLGDLYRLDAVTLHWTALTPVGGIPPLARSYHGLAAAGELLYLFGGLGENGILQASHAVVVVIDGAEHGVVVIDGASLWQQHSSTTLFSWTRRR